MKKRVIIWCGIFALCYSLMGANIVFAGWTANLHAQGQDLGGIKTCEVSIGVDTESKTADAPPAPPDFSVNMELWNVKGDDWQGAYNEDIRQEGDTSYKWVIAINPHGDIMPPDARSATISWDPSQFGGGYFELQEGTDGTGTVVVSDMKEVTTYDVTGENEDQYFLLVYSPCIEIDATIEDAINILQILVGETPAGFSPENKDLNGDGDTGMADVLYILTHLACD